MYLFSQCPQLMAVDEDRKIDWPVNQQSAKASASLQMPQWSSYQSSSGFCLELVKQQVSGPDHANPPILLRIGVAHSYSLTSRVSQFKLEVNINLQKVTTPAHQNLATPRKSVRAEGRYVLTALAVKLLTGGSVDRQVIVASSRWVPPRAVSWHGKIGFNHHSPPLASYHIHNPS